MFLRRFCYPIGLFLSGLHNIIGSVKQVITVLLGKAATRKRKREIEFISFRQMMLQSVDSHTVNILISHFSQKANLSALCKGEKESQEKNLEMCQPLKNNQLL